MVDKSIKVVLSIVDSERRGHSTDYKPEYILSTVWQYGLWSFQKGGKKLEKILTKNQNSQRKLLNRNVLLN